MVIEGATGHRIRVGIRKQNTVDVDVLNTTLETGLKNVYNNSKSVSAEEETTPNEADRLPN